jgi:hypothetical protein
MGVQGHGSSRGHKALAPSDERSEQFQGHGNYRGPFHFSYSEVTMNPHCTAIAGSRTLGEVYMQFIHDRVQALVKAGRTIATGCAVGSDAIVIDSCLLLDTQPQVVAIGRSDGQGFWRGSVPTNILKRCITTWEAGGSIDTVGLNQRLVNRTRALVNQAHSLVAFFGQQHSPGTLLSCKLAVSRDIPTVAFALENFALPSLGEGQWQPLATQGIWATAQRWAT